VRLNARANGKAVVRLSVAGMSDSVTVTVWQRIASVWLEPAQCRSVGIPLTVGDSIQVSPTTMALDNAGNFIADTARVRAAVRGMTFINGDLSFGGIKVSPTGMVTALAARWSNIYGTATTPEEGTVTGICFFMPQDKF
jgi:hypothetical protein